jgi:mannose-6-phosphate isomerase
VADIALLKNAIQPYAWGSTTAIPRLLGVPNPTATPQAELWMGAHPKAPSMVATDDGWIRLDDVIRRSPDDILGPQVSRAFERSLPFLFKVLAAAAPLSIQAHPDRHHAREGFERENRGGLAFDAPERNYRDPHPKPECLCALTPFWAMCGFRPPETILEHLRMFCRRDLKEEIFAFARQCNADGLKQLIGTLLSLDPERRRKAVDEALSCTAAGRQDETLAWIPILARHYPGDIGALAPAWMNVLRLEPGQALFLPEGVLHSYLEGTGIEIMANSDNVIRGGLTSKHIDLSELLKVVDFGSHAAERVCTEKRGATETVYLTPAPEFALSAIDLKSGDCFQSGSERNVEILLCIDGKAVLQELAPGGRRLPIDRGTSVLVPAAAPAYRLTGPATLYRATVPSPIALDKTKRFN